MSIYSAVVGGFLTYRSPAVTVVNAGSGMEECSGIGVSRTYGQTVWCHDDSGDTGRIFAFNTTSGTLRKTFNLVSPIDSTQWPNSDFEELSLLQRPSGGDMIFVFDDTSQSGTGAQVLYRLIEPNPTTGAAVQTVAAHRLTVTFPGTVYSEASFVDPLDGHLIVFKSNTQQAAGVEVYRSTVPVTIASHGTAISTTLIAQLTNFAPQLGAGPGLGRINDWAGSADIAPDRSCIVVHSTGTWTAPATAYDRVFVWQIADPITTSIATALATTPLLCTNDGTGRDIISEQQGESIAFLSGSTGYMRISEGNARPIHIFDDLTPNPPPPPPIVSEFIDGRSLTAGGSPLWSTATRQYMVWNNRNDTVSVASAPRDRRGWTGPATVHVFGTGTTAAVETAGLHLPAKRDDHNYFSICRMDSGHVFVAGNGHNPGSSGNERMGFLRSVNPDDITTWMDPFVGLPGVNTDAVTYPTFGSWGDGTPWMMFRTGSSGNGDFHLWNNGVGSSTWTYVGEIWRGQNVTPTFDGEQDFSFYMNTPFVEPTGYPNPGRMHVVGVWRIRAGGGNLEVVHPSYCYTDNKGTTWRDINGVAQALPMTVNRTGMWMFPGMYDPRDGTDDLLNGGTLTVLPNGDIHCTFAGNTEPAVHIWRDSSAIWESEDFLWPGLPASGDNYAASNLVFAPYRGELWSIGEGGASLRTRFWKHGSTDQSRVGGSLPTGAGVLPAFTGGGSFPEGPEYDREAFKRWGTVEILLPLVGVPKIYGLGLGALSR